MTTTVHKNLVVLARVLERLERSHVPVDPEQYRAVVDHLAAELEIAPRDAGFEAVLDNFPAAAELYENLTYQHAGLCRSPLELSLGAELGTKALLARLARESAQAKPASGS